jgi:hypothetical protein
MGELCFTDAVGVLTREGGQSVVTADFNADGLSDVATTHSISGGHVVCIHLADGAGALSTCRSPLTATPTNIERLLAADLDGDGHTDLVARPGGDDPFPIWGEGDGTFELGTLPEHPGTPHPRLFAATGLLDDGASVDLAYYELSRGVAAALNNGDRTFTLAPVDGDLPAGFTIGYAGDAAIGDFNDDGENDVAASEQFQFVVRDFNGDGFPDVASRDRVWLVPGDGVGGFAEAVGPFEAGINLTNASSGTWTINDDAEFGDAGGPIAADVNSDGFTDLISVASDDSVRVLLGESDGLFRSASAISFFPEGRDPTAIAAGDFNGDGVDDLVVLNAGTANLVLLLSNP